MTEDGHDRSGQGTPTQPSLETLVELARAQRTPTVRVDGAAIVRAVGRRRAAQVRWLVGSTVLAAAAAWLLFARIVPSWSTAMAPATAESASHVHVGGGGASGGELVPRGDDAARAGIARDGTPSPTESSQPAVAESEPVEPHATTEPPSVVPDATTEPAPAVAETPGSATPSAASLARDAERAMAQRRPRDAIALLDTLVRRYPNHASAKTALLDLGRLLRETGRDDDARCAYRRFGARWPKDPMRAEVDRMITALGPGPRCRGLRPIRG